MNIFTVSFFGHRQISNPFPVENALETLVYELLMKKEYIQFLVGRDGEFDRLVSRVVRKVMRMVGDDNGALVLVLAYITAEYEKNEEFFLAYYDEIEVCAQAAEGYFKSAHQMRNRAMVDRSDLVVFYLQQQSGGAYQTMRYAQKTGVNVVYLLDRGKLH